MSISLSSQVVRCARSRFGDFSLERHVEGFYKVLGRREIPGEGGRTFLQDLKRRYPVVDGPTGRLARVQAIYRSVLERLEGPIGFPQLGSLLRQQDQRGAAVVLELMADTYGENLLRRSRSSSVSLRRGYQLPLFQFQEPEVA